MSAIEGFRVRLRAINADFVDSAIAIHREYSASMDALAKEYSAEAEVDKELFDLVLTAEIAVMQKAMKDGGL